MGPAAQVFRFCTAGPATPPSSDSADPKGPALRKWKGLKTTSDYKEKYSGNRVEKPKEGR